MDNWFLYVDNVVLLLILIVLGFFMYTITCCIQIQIFFFLYSLLALLFSFFFELARIMLTRRLETGYPYLFPIERKSIQCSQCCTINHDVSCRVFWDILYQIEEIPFYSSSLRVLKKNEWVLNFIKCFFCIYDQIVYLILLMWLVTLVDFGILNQTSLLDKTAFVHYYE